MGSGIRNTAEDAPIEIERDGGGFLFFSPLQEERHARLPKNQIPLLYVCVCCYTYESQHFTEKSPFLFIYFITILFFLSKMFFFRFLQTRLVLWERRKIS